MRPRILAFAAAALLLAACGTAQASPPVWAAKPPHPTKTTASPTPTPAPTTTPPPTTEPPPTTTPAPTTTPPIPVPGLSLVFSDEFDGTSLDTSKWEPNWFGDGGVMNNVGTYASNVSVSGGLLHLQLADMGGTVTGALVHTGYTTGRYQLPVGDYVEARVYFPGDGTTVQDGYNFSAWWASGPSWPAAGEHDIAEVITEGAPTSRIKINYHSPTVDWNLFASPACCWGSAFHTFGLYRGAGYADVYWDGALQAHYTTADNGVGEELILNAGKSNSRTPVLGEAGAVLVDYVRAYG